MRQVTLRLPDELARELRRAAEAHGYSVNAYAAAVLGAAVDPELAGDETARIRERLARAGLLAEPPNKAVRRPGRKALRKAREEAGRGRPLSDLVAEERR